MTADEFFKVIVERGNRRPFQPFVVELLDGNQIEIDLPHSLAVRGGFASGFARGKRIVRLDSHNVKRIIDAPVDAAASQEA